MLLNNKPLLRVIAILRYALIKNKSKENKMNELKDYKELVNNLIKEIEAYENKPTKACSLRIRKLSNQIGKDGVQLRAALVAADKAN